MPSWQNTDKENTRMGMKIVIYFVNDEKVTKKQGILNFDHKDQQSTCKRLPVKNNQRITYVYQLKTTDRGSSSNNVLNPLLNQNKGHKSKTPQKGGLDPPSQRPHGKYIQVIHVHINTTENISRTKKNITDKETDNSCRGKRNRYHQVSIIII